MYIHVDSRYIKKKSCSIWDQFMDDLCMKIIINSIWLLQAQR